MAVITTCFRTLVAYLLLASFLIVQADLPVAHMAAERAAATGEKCVPHQCCCSTEAQQNGKCCCASQKVPGTGYSLRAARCADDQPQGDAPVVVKFQVVLPPFMALVTRDIEVPTLTIPQALPAPCDSEPPDPPPRLLVVA